MTSKQPQDFLPSVNIQVNIRCGNCPDHSDEYYSFDCDGDGDSGFNHYCNFGGTKKSLHSSDKINSDACPRAKAAFEKAVGVFCASHSSAGEPVLELLDALRKHANAEYKEAELSDNEREMRIHLEYENRIWGIMKSLRGGGAP